MPKQQRGFKRTDRLNSQFLEVLSQIFLFEVEDPRVKQVQVTAVDVAPDLSFARVFYVMLSQDESTPSVEVEQTLERLSGFLRRKVGERLQLRQLPVLRFSFDTSISRGRRIEQLLAGVEPSEDKSSEE